MAPSQRKRVRVMEIEPVTNVAEVYGHVIDEVIHKVWENLQDDFLMEGIEKTDLTELGQSWETNLRKSGAIEFMMTDGKGVPALTTVGNASTQAPAPVIDLNVPYGGTDQHQAHRMHALSSFEPLTMTTTAVTLLPNTQAHVDATSLPMQTPGPVFIGGGEPTKVDFLPLAASAVTSGEEPNMLPYISGGPGESSNGNRGWPHLDDEHGRQPSNMQEPAPLMYHNGSDFADNSSYANYGQEEGESGHGRKQKLLEDQKPSTRLSTTLTLDLFGNYVSQRD